LIRASLFRSIMLKMQKASG